MKNIKKNNPNIILISDFDLSRMHGAVVRIMAFVYNCKERGIQVTIVAPKPSKTELMLDLKGIELSYISIKQKEKSIINTLIKARALIKRARELQDKNSIFLIETSILGGYFAISGFVEYILDVHGIVFSEVSYSDYPNRIQKMFCSKSTEFLEKIAVKRAKKVIVVSNSMKKYIADKWKKAANEIIVIPNGYFDSIVSNITKSKIKEKKGMITFVGLLSKWANIEKIIRVADILKNEKATFYIVGDDPDNYRQKLEYLVHSLGLTNVVFTGSVPLQEAYKIIARSDIVIFPFPRLICTEVACPIKVLEYIAFGKPMVLDEVSDISRYLKEKDAALICNPNSDTEFAENIRLLLKDEKLRKRIGSNAKNISKEFSWEIQGYKLVEILKNM